MGNIINDIVEEINVKPNKNKLVLKWVVSISITLIGIAFVLGQFRSSFFYRLDGIEESVKKNTESIQDIRNTVDNGLHTVNSKIDKVYDDGFVVFTDYQEFNKKQLILILDYGQNNKNLLKEILELNMQEKNKNVGTKIDQSKNDEVISKKTYSIGVIELDSKTKNNYIKLTKSIENETGDTVFNLTGATKEYINRLDRNKYKIDNIIRNISQSNLFDITYRNK